MKKKQCVKGLADGDFAVPYVIKDGQYKKAYPVDSSKQDDWWRLSFNTDRFS